MKLVTSEQMKNLEKIAIDDFGVPSLLLMENAATGFCHVLSETIDLNEKAIGVFCGRGNNGGDGFAIARLLHNCGYNVSCVIGFDEKDAENNLTKDSFINYTVAKKMGIGMLRFGQKSADYTIIIDAILGTGLKGAPKALEDDMIKVINESNATVIAVDIPSGADAACGKIFGSCVRASYTITFCLPKVGHFLYPAKKYAGKLICVPISVPQKTIDCFDSGFYALDDDIFSFLPKRNETSHKGDFGKVLACVGSENMSGAAMLSVSAVFKSGVGMVTAASFEDVLKNIVLNTPEAMTLPLNDNMDILPVISALEKNDVLLLGCGIGRSKKTEAFTKELFCSCEKPMVIDADGINNLSENIDILYKKKASVILTPHTVEFSRMTGLSPEYINENRLSLAIDFSKKFDVTLVLKGADTIVSSPDGKVYICSVANSGLSTAGSGDVLSGIIAGLLAQGSKPDIAAAAGVYIHSLSGLLASSSLGERSMTASDIISNLPSVLKKIK